jgi:UDP-N-acetylglucosamine transferase subunit ALG13
MIFALFGTNPYPFMRLADWLDRLAREEGQDIEAQTGVTPALAHCRSFDFASYATIQAKMEFAGIVIAQGGYGSCLDALHLGCKLIIVPRRPEFGECLDNQDELSSYLAEHSEAIVVDTYEALRQALASVGTKRTHARPLPEAFGAKVGAAINDFLGGT